MALEEPNSISMTPISDEELVGTIFADRYELLSIIGKGGMGKVYKARHKLMRRIVAIKVVHPHLVSNAYTMARFQQEAEAASCLNHPNIVAVHDFGLLPRAYLVMDYLDGICLADLLENDAHLSLGRSLNIFVQICAALVHAHKHGVVHRDLKPSNVMLVTVDGKKDFVKIVDFGIAKLMLKDNPADTGLTSTGEIFGSPHYMSPEQCRGKPMDARSDIYSLGCIMYRTLTGQRPIPGHDLLECLYNHVTVPPGRFKDVCPEIDIPDMLEVIVLKCMEKKQENRFQTMTELKDVLEAEVVLVPSTKEQPGKLKKAHIAPIGTIQGNNDTTTTEASRVALAAEAGRVAFAAEESLAAFAAESGRVAFAAELGRAASAAELGRAASAAELGRAASAAEAARAASAAEVGRAAFAAEAERVASVAEAELASFAAESERVASAAEVERAAGATEPGREVSAAEKSCSASVAELGRVIAAVEASRAAAAAESARAASVIEAALAASAHEASLVALAREASLVASAHEASLAASALESGRAASAAEAGRAASAAEAGRAASAAEAGRAASAAEAGRVASAAEADRAASAAEDRQAPSDSND